MAYCGTNQFIARARLKLRSGCNLDSGETGFVPVSSFLNMLELSWTPDGLPRARVALCSAAGEAMGKEGWVSYIGKDGHCNLIPFHWTRFQRKRDGSPRLRAAVAAAVEERPASAPPPARSPQPKSPPVMSPAKQQSPAPPRTAAPTKAERSPPPTSAAGAKAARASRRPLSATATAASSPPNLAAATASSSNDPAAKAAPQEASDTPRKADAKAAERFKMQTSEELRELIASFKGTLQEEQTSLAGLQSTLKQTLGTSLFKKDKKIPELVKSWAIKAEISKMDFRKHVRAEIEWTNVKEIDELFNEIDADHGGTLDVPELTAAMKDLQAEAKAKSAHVDAITGQIAKLEARIKDVEDVMRATEAAETQEHEYEVIKGGHSIEAMLGKELMRRSTKITDLVNTWESTNGEIDKAQFRRNVRSMGIEANDETLNGLFDSQDKDGGGTLDLGEIRRALEVWKMAMNEADKKAASMKKTIAALWKSAKTAQMDLSKQQADEAAAAKAEAEAAAQRLEEEQLLAREAAKLKQARALAAKKQKELDAAAFEAKILARRQAQNEQM